MKQQTLAMAADQDEGFEPYRKPTKRDTFLATMEQIVPWQELCSVIEPHYPKAGNWRPPIGLEHLPTQPASRIDELLPHIWQPTQAPS